MDNITKQDRITLKNLKVADFASEETLCFNATVVFDGTPIAEARNDGHGGSTFLHALNGKAGLLAQAEAFAKARIGQHCRAGGRVYAIQRTPTVRAGIQRTGTVETQTEIEIGIAGQTGHCRQPTESAGRGLRRQL